jgi:predicted RecA/RadA family phage recombinase
MRNYVQPGDTVTLLAPAALASGEPFAVGALFGVAAYAAGSGDEVEAKRTGVFDLPKTTGEAWTVGARLYWNAGTKKLTTTVGSNLFVGAALAAAGESAETGRVILAGTVAAVPPPPPPPPPGP